LREEKNVMLKLSTVFSVIAILSISMVISGCAGPSSNQQVQANVITKTSGETVRLFHGGTKEAKEAFCLNETVPVYRQSYERYSRELKEVGKVKITQYSGEHYFDAEVVEGEVREGDIAKKPSAACLVQLPVPEEK
jgi:hypothetical protein